MTIDTSAPLSIDVVLAAGLRWFYVTARPADAVVERRGACMKTADRVLRFVPVSATDNPLIVVDLLDVHWGLSSEPTTELTAPQRIAILGTELATLRIPSSAQHYLGITGTVVLDAPAHPSLVQVLCCTPLRPRLSPTRQPGLRSPRVRDGGRGCTWHVDGHRRAIWPLIDANQTARQ